MLYFRMETGIAPGENLDSIDNFAKPTVLLFDVLLSR
jgi:hypothetical protein